MKSFEKAEIRVVTLSGEDVLTASIEQGGGEI